MTAAETGAAWPTSETGQRRITGTWRNLARLGFGGFFLAMAVYNLVVTLPDAATAYRDLAEGLAWPGVDRLVLDVMEPAAGWFAALVAAFEIAVGCLVLSKGRRVRVGLWAAVAFMVGLAPIVSVYALTNIPLVVWAGVLLLRDYDRSVLDLVWRR